MIRNCQRVFLIVASCFFVSPAPVCSQMAQQVSLFDGKSFSGWQGDTTRTWRIEDGAFVAGSEEKPAPRNEFLCTTKRYSDFELSLEFRIEGTEKLNAGVQFRTDFTNHGSQGEPQFHDVVGYQADIGKGFHGCLYDESRRRKVLARPDEATDQKVTAAVPKDGWQSYRIRAVGKRIQLWLNGIQTVVYTEDDESIASDGFIALQIHGRMVGTIAYRNISLQDLSKASSKLSIDDFSWISGHWNGKALGGRFEETWNPPMGGEMIGMFKLVKDGNVGFYELLTIVPEGDSFVLRLKHFSKGLVGWEEKDKSIEFPLVRATPTEIAFEGLVFSRSTASTRDKMKIEVTMKGQEAPLAFECLRTE